MPNMWATERLFLRVNIRSVKDSNADGTGAIPGPIAWLDYYQQIGIGVLQRAATDSRDVPNEPNEEVASSRTPPVQRSGSLAISLPACGFRIFA